MSDAAKLTINKKVTCKYVFFPTYMKTRVRHQTRSAGQLQNPESHSQTLSNQHPKPFKPKEKSHEMADFNNSATVTTVKLRPLRILFSHIKAGVPLSRES